MPRAVRYVVLVLVSLSLVATSASAHGSSPSGLAGKLARALRVSGLGSARASALAVDLKTGEVVFKRHRYVSLAPASNEKLVVTYAALVRLGPTFRFHTEVLGTGGQAGSAWRGDLVLRGYGDPTLSTQDLRFLARRIRSAGIRRVTGRVLGDESFFDSKRGVRGWKSDFYFNESPPLSALSVDRGVYRGRETASPAAAAAAEFRATLLSAGVKVRGKAGVGRATEPSLLLARAHSGRLLPILRFMDRSSDNFTAELVLKQLGSLRHRGTSAAGAAVVRGALSEAGISLRGTRIVDGSGLSTLDRLTAETLVTTLQTAWSSPVLRKPFFSTLAVSGESGTLRKRLTTPPARGHIHAKTGTTNEASSLSGYVKGRYAFSILHNGYPLASWFAKQAEDRFVTVLAAAK